ncbi:MAG: hypothetical protein CVU84_03585 [Firmicutes bacterium HGW-Firmicutes-1]|jgi:Na+-driven multidrug efflux pump|nr:MAG: hypothetical protein CVU84_03585 [Firmicutes bacterium HGW-Firmicutes-1]
MELREVLSVLDIFALVFFIILCILAMIKPKKAFELLRNKKKKDIIPDPKVYNKVRLYAAIFLLLAGIGLAELFI